MIRYIFRFCILAIIISQNLEVFANCRSSGVYTWPSSSLISQNPVFIIEGYGFSQDLVKNLNKTQKTYLKCGNSIVPLAVIRINEGQYQLTQAILKPDRVLTPGYTYHLIVEEFRENSRKIHYSVYAEWTVKEGLDTIAPFWQVKPVYLCKQLTYFGCGPATYVKFCGLFSDLSPVKILARVKSVKTGLSSEYYISGFDVGHDMCSGEFEFIEEGLYEASFALMDASGNHLEDFTAPISFNAPGNKDQYNDPYDKPQKKCECEYRLDSLLKTSANSEAMRGEVIIDNKPPLKIIRERNYHWETIAFISGGLLLLLYYIFKLRQTPERID